MAKRKSTKGQTTIRTMQKTKDRATRTPLKPSGCFLSLPREDFVVTLNLSNN